MGALYVMRHGRTVLDDEKRSDGWLDYPLSDEGRIGLIDAQQFLKNAPIKCVVTCSLRRCAETAHIIASGILSHPAVGITDATRTWNLGELIGTKKKPNKPLVKFFLANPDEKPKDGESLNEFRSRFFAILHELVKDVDTTDCSILLVCSGSAIREISMALAGDRECYDLDEAGLLMLVPLNGAIHCNVIMGSKDDDNHDWYS